MIFEIKHVLSQQRGAADILQFLAFVDDEALRAAEAALVGKTDPERTEAARAFVVLRSDSVASDALKAELPWHVR